MTEFQHAPRASTSPRPVAKPEGCAVELCDFAKQHVQGVYELHEAVFPVRYSMKVVESMLRPDRLAVVAVAHVPVAGLEALAVTQERVVGFISCCLRDSDDLCGLLFHKKRVYISTFGVLPEFQRRGIATRLLAELRVRALERWQHDTRVADRLALHVQATNTGALAFYRAAGFEQEQFVAGYYHFTPQTLPQELRDKFDWSPDALVLSAPLDPTRQERACGLAACWRLAVRALCPPRKYNQLHQQQHTQ